MPHAIGDHALLADGRTAALVAPDGNVGWMCWPRFDSPAWLLGILDEARGGCMRVAPPAGARVVERGYLPDSLVLRTVWQTAGGGRLRVDDALAWDGPRRLVRSLHAEGAAVDALVELRPAPDYARAVAHVTVDGNRAHLDAPSLRLDVTGPAAWEPAGDALVQRVHLEPGETLGVCIAGAGESVPPAAVPPLVDCTVAWWRSMSRRMRWAASALGARSLDDLDARVHLAGRVLTGLRWRQGPPVAAPTTSLPQWPGGGRTWDYRYAWLRDGALAAMALLRLGLVDAAVDIGAWCGRACTGDGAPAMLRVDGTPSPVEHELAHLTGHGGARPVRVGNAAARQAQVDVLGEVLELAHALDGADALPDELRAVVARLAGAAAERWRQPDHGIWEVRGVPRAYTHSRLMAWTALRRAASLADRGAVARHEGWGGAADRIAAAILRDGREPAGWLRLHDRGGGPDAALTLAPLLGFLPPRDPTVIATLDVIEQRLGRSGLLDRYRGQPDGLADPCGPFVFPTFWMAAARERCGGDGAPWMGAAAATAGPLGLMGEVADPATGRALGNYPQVQSHAALVMAATAPRR